MDLDAQLKGMGIEVMGEVTQGGKEVLTTGALEFLARLAGAFEHRRQLLLARRGQRQEDLDAGKKPDFLLETDGIRRGGWQISLVPHDLQDRRVEITGPASDRKMVINALNSSAKTFMADLEDATAPSWSNVLQGQINLRDAVTRSIEYVSPQGKRYALQEQVATLIVRPRGWHLGEKHVLFQGKPISASLFDFGLYLYHNAHRLLANGSGPYFYLPKLEGHLEARLWNDVFVFAQQMIGIPQGTIKATVLIETILAAFEMDEILFELREHVAGLNCGRWDYMFSYLKKFRHDPKVLLPDRAQVTMESPFMRAYSLLTIQTCHRRGAHAIGGMAAQIPIKNEPVANEEALRKVRADKEREVRDGYDGTWVAHPGLVPIALEVFDAGMPTPNQITRLRDDVQIARRDLLEVPRGEITEAGLRLNVSVGIQYLEAWLRGFGAVPIFHLMEDAATAEISRSQVWQWIRHPAGILNDGRKVTSEWVQALIEETLSDLQAKINDHEGKTRKFAEAGQLFAKLVLADEFVEFLTMPGYELL